MPPIRFGLCTLLFGAMTACGVLEPILGPDGGADARVVDGAGDAIPGDASSDVKPLDSGDGGVTDAEAGAPFTCGAKVCDSTTHYCE